MRIFLVQSEFYVQRTTKKILIDNHYKTIYESESELSELPTIG